MDTGTIRDVVTVEDLPVEDQVRHELFDGSLHVSPLGTLRHQQVVANLHLALAALVPADLAVLPGASVAVDELNRAIPDVVVLTREALSRGGLGVRPEDVRLVAEVVSPSTARFDRTVKRDVFAEWGIPTYWVLDPRDETVKRFGSDPHPGWADNLSVAAIFAR